jgi:hypothetical protein
MHALAFESPVRAQCRSVDWRRHPDALAQQQPLLPSLAAQASIAALRHLGRRYQFTGSVA